MSKLSDIRKLSRSAKDDSSSQEERTVHEALRKKYIETLEVLQAMTGEIEALKKENEGLRSNRISGSSSISQGEEEGNLSELLNRFNEQTVELKRAKNQLLSAQNDLTEQTEQLKARWLEENNARRKLEGDHKQVVKGLEDRLQKADERLSSFHVLNQEFGSLTQSMEMMRVQEQRNRDVCEGLATELRHYKVQLEASLQTCSVLEESLMDSKQEYERLQQESHEVNQKQSTARENVLKEKLVEAEHRESLLRKTLDQELKERLSEVSSLKSQIEKLRATEVSSGPTESSSVFFTHLSDSDHHEQDDTAACASSLLCMRCREDVSAEAEFVSASLPEPLPPGDEKEQLQLQQNEHCEVVEELKYNFEEFVRLRRENKQLKLQLAEFASWDVSKAGRLLLSQHSTGALPEGKTVSKRTKTIRSGKSS